MNAPRSMQIGIRLPAARPVDEVLATVRRSEAGGLDAVWFPDSHLNYREVWSLLGAAAVSTERLQLAVTVTNLVTRHPTVTASAARTIQEASGGRFLLGIGAGGSRRTPYAMLSSGVAGLAGRTLVITFPGSTRGARETLAALAPGLVKAVSGLRRSGA